MNIKGLSTNLLLIVVGAVVIIGGFAYTTLRVTPESSDTETSAAITETEMEGEESTASATPQGTATAPKPTPSKPTTQTPATNTPPAPEQGPQTTEPEMQPAPEPEETIPEEILTAPYNPNFLAASRITPEIPSENERATLPSCEGKRFVVDPVNLSIVTSITPTGATNSSGVPDYTVFKVSGSSDVNKYDLVAPNDVWITHLAQETGITADPEDTTIYFALCRDVIGYVTHIKELSSDSYKIITDSVCHGKPHTGPNACKIEILKLISQGSSLGKVGRIEGAFGVGIIDLRHERGFSNASTLPIKTNFAACPFGYFLHAANYYNLLQSPNSLCAAP